MPKPIKFHPSAVREAGAAYRWYAARSERAAEQFADALERAVAQVAERPDSFPGHLANTKRCLLTRYPFLVVFQELADAIEVIGLPTAVGGRGTGRDASNEVSWHRV